MPQLNSGDVVMAGDFPVTILRANNVAGRFSGEGWVKVPYLADTKIHVTYQNIKVNTDHKLIDGYFETSYKASGQNIASVDTLLANISITFKNIVDAIKHYDGSDSSKAAVAKADSLLEASNTAIQGSSWVSSTDQATVQNAIDSTQQAIQDLETGGCTILKGGGPPFVASAFNKQLVDCNTQAEKLINTLNTTSPYTTLAASWEQEAASAAVNGLGLIKNEDDDYANSNADVNHPNWGISPDGELIYSVIGFPTRVISRDQPYFIIGFDATDPTTKALIRYRWDKETNRYYINGDSKLTPLVVTHPANQNVSQPTWVYEVLSDFCFYHKQLISLSYSAPGDQTSTIKSLTDLGLWIGNTLLGNHSPSCPNSFVTSDLLKDCTTKVEAEAATTALTNLVGENDKILCTNQQLVAQINKTCKQGLLGISYDDLTAFFSTLASDHSIGEEEENAILMLMSSINTNNYLDFFDLLEANNNALLINLVNEMDDAALPWQGNNYSNYMRALVTMCNQIRADYVKRFGDPTENTNIIHLDRCIYTPSKLYDPTATFYSINQGFYDSNTGYIDIKEYDYKSGSYNAPTILNLGKFSPLSPILLHFDKQSIPLIDLAIDGIAPDDGANYLVPAIFLKYTADKNMNDEIKSSTMLAIDAATIVGSGGTALAADVLLIRRLWALTEVAGAVGNIGVNTGAITEGTNTYKIVQAYNLTMGIVGVGHLGSGIINFTKSLPNDVFSTIKLKQSLRQAVTNAYLNYKVAVTNLGELGDAERELVNSHIQKFRLLGVVDEIAEAQRKIINQFINNIQNENSLRKGNFGEIASDLNLTDKGYNPLHTRITDIDAPTKQGIDGVFEKNGIYYIVEAKYKGTARLQMMADGITKQMSDPWIKGENRLLKAVGKSTAADIVNAGYRRILAEIAPDGTIVYKELDYKADIVGVFNP